MPFTRRFTLLALLGLLVALVSAAPAAAQGSTVGPGGGSTAILAPPAEGSATQPPALVAPALPEFKFDFWLVLNRYRFFGWTATWRLASSDAAIVPPRIRLFR